MGSPDRAEPAGRGGGHGPRTGPQRGRVPLFPIGLARHADPDLGFHVDAGTVALGGAVSVALLGALVAGVALWRVRRSTRVPSAGGVSRWGKVAAELGTPAPAVTGLSLASGTPGRPGRIAVGGTVLSVMGVLAAFVFSASVDRLRGEPDLYGWGFDAVMESEFSDTDDPVLPPGLETDPDVLDMSTLYLQIPVTLDGTPTFATAVTEPAESLDPVMVRGDAPGAPMSWRSAETRWRPSARTSATRSTSRSVRRRTGCGSPASSRSRSPPTEAPRRPVPTSARPASPARGPRFCADSDSCTSAVALGLRDDADLVGLRGAVRGPGRRPLGRPPGAAGRDRPAHRRRGPPRYMAIFMAALAAAAISFATTTTVRQRRRDLAVLRVLGMTARHIRSVVVVLVLALTGFGPCSAECSGSSWAARCGER